jgi:hypothetical protein
LVVGAGGAPAQSGGTVVGVDVLLYEHQIWPTISPCVFPNRRMTRVLNGAIAQYGKPKTIRFDNGPELTSHLGHRQQDRRCLHPARQAN